MAVQESEKPSLTRALLLACMLGAEVGSLGALLSEQALLWAVGHALAALSAAGVARHVLGPSGKLAPLGAAAALVLSLPGVGVLGFWLVVLPAWRRIEPARNGGRLEMELPGSRKNGLSAELLPGSSPGDLEPIRQLLLHRVAPVAARTSAVMALRRMDARRATPLLRLAFGDPSEDVRLLAFAILERREKQLRAQLSGALQALETYGTALTPLEVAAAHGRIAGQHWELVYGGFVSSDMEAPVLEQAARHAQLALAQRVDGASSVLLARILLRQGRQASAWSWLERAERAGVAPAVSAPLFAEAAFGLRRFGEIRSLLERAPPLQLRRAEVGPVVAFWTGVARQ